jgi:hypothetical protein
MRAGIMTNGFIHMILTIACANVKNLKPQKSGEGLPHTLSKGMRKVGLPGRVQM